MRNKGKVLISASTFGNCGRESLDILEKAGLKIVRNPYDRRLKPDEIINLGKGCKGILAGLETFSGDTLKRLPELKVISRVGTGTDNIDLKAAESLRIVIRNTPDAPTQAVAELSVGLALDLLRKISLSDAYLKRGEWVKIAGNLLNGKVVGIIGLGRIGKRVAELLIGFGAMVIAYDIVEDPHWLKVKSVKMIGLETLLRRGDIVMIHVSGKDRLIGEAEFSMMKKGAYLINTSRGGILDETALYKVLKDGRLAGAALDVFNKEPYTGPLRELDNVILTPHVGSHTEETRIKMETEAVRNLLDEIKRIEDERKKD